MDEVDTEGTFIMWRQVLVLSILAFLATMAARGEEGIRPASNDDEPHVTVGARPYELDWANRTEPAHPQSVDFEDLNGWRVRCLDEADAQVYRSKQEQIFGQFTAKLVYTGKSARSRFVLEPPEPLPIPGPFTAVDLWVRGNNWGWVSPSAAARVDVAVLVRDAKEETYRIDLGVEDFDYWSLMHATCVSPDGAKRLYEPIGQPNDGVIDFPAKFIGIEITGCAGTQPERIYLDALSFYEMQYPPLTFDPIPETLPWPTTPDTILPDATQGESLEVKYEPSDGSLSGIVASLKGQSFQPCFKGGITFEIDGRRVRPGDEGVAATLAGDRAEGAKHVYEWDLKIGGAAIRYRYAMERKNNSFIVDIAADGNYAAQFDIGLAKGLPEPKTVFMPYLTYGDDWPKVVCAATPQGPLFLLSIMDYYNSDASELFGAPRVHDPEAAGYTGGAVYNPTTAGKRNPLRERLFINISGDVQAVLPNIPNPNCDTGEIAREYVWRNIGSLFQNEMLSKYKAYGIDKFIACHHEVGWREGGESFTMRDRPAPSIGDEKLAEYGAFVKGLGYRFGTYTNYVDFAPVNGNWNENDVCLNSDGSWQKAWPRTYAQKPLRAVEREAYYAPRINERYGTTAQYCDVHTAYTPWGRTDYDARTPGAGMFRTQFNAFARLLSNESLAHHGPVFSEGNHHWFYAGIVDGNYATMIPYGRGWQQAHLVDFDLLKMHTKMTDFGMGAPQMYFGTGGDWAKNPSRLSAYFDRFHVATIAFGHIGYLSEEWGFDGTLKSYYLLQALQQRYALVPVDTIRYFDGEKLVDTSAAIATDAYKRQQICTTYKNGLTTWCNLSFDQEWRATVNGQPYVLPPASFAAFKPNDILAYSAIIDGQRHELVWCKDYLYLDSRDAIVRTPVIATCGTVAVKPDGDGTWWIIPAPKSEEVTLALAWLGAGPETQFTATAYNEKGEAAGDATVLHGATEVTVLASKDASVMKYRLVAAMRPPAASRITKIEPQSRSQVTTTGMDVQVAVDVPADKDVSTLEIAWAAGPLGEPDWDTGKAQVSRSDPASPAMATLRVAMPGKAPLHKRSWFRFWPAWEQDSPEMTRWMDITAVPSFDLTFLSTTVHAYGRASIEFPTQVQSHFVSGPVTAALQVIAPELAAKPMQKSFVLQPGAIQTVTWSVRPPDFPMLTELRFQANGAGHSVEAVRYVRIRPVKWIVADLIKTPIASRGLCVRGRGEEPYDSAATGALVDITSEMVGGEQMDVIFTHPPYKTGVGYVFFTIPVKLPEGHPRAEFALGFRNGCTTHDGCVFKLIVVDQGTDTEVFNEQYATVDACARRSADLAPFAGHEVTLKLLTDVGPQDDSYSDWAAWGAPRIVMDDSAVEAQLLEKKPAAFWTSPPEPLKGLKRADLATVTAARLTMETSGADGDAYATTVYLNGVKLGDTPASGSDTEWRPAELPLSKTAIAALEKLNSVVIKNPRNDSMKVRSLCLRLELEDGRKASSWVDTGPYCSDCGWPYDEGECVPVGQDLPEMTLFLPMN